jgi:type IV pilus assembly protein PilA
MKIPNRGEKGFTLIELLIVVAILGVLAAIVIPNVGRFIGRGKTESAATELASIQAATFSMMVDNNLASLNATRTAANATSDMTIFPNAAYHLYAMNVSGTVVNYVAAATTKGVYYVDGLGTVTQNSTGY